MTQSNGLSRRQFLRHGAALVAAPMIIPSGVLAAPGRLGANDRIGIAGIGIGRQGSGVFGQAAGSGLTRVVAIADVNITRAREMVAKFKGEAAYQDYRKVLERSDVDAIVTATPDHWRAIVCIAACQAGKDVYAEKPMSLTIREGRLMAQAVRKYNRVFQTGSQQRSIPLNRFGCELVRNGRIGKIKRVIAFNYPSPWHGALPAQPVPEGIDWDMWCGPTEVVPYNKDLYTPRANPGWISFRPYSGGEVTGWGSHGFDQVQWALGMDESGPVEVWTEGGKFEPPTYTAPEPQTRGDKICSVPKVFFRYPGDVVMELAANGPRGGAIFIGEKGTITLDRNFLKTDPPELAKDTIKDGEIHLYESKDHVGNWLDCIKSRERCIADVETGHRSGTICHLTNIAREIGRPLKWDSVKEEFAGDSAANALLDRARRKPYLLPETV